MTPSIHLHQAVWILRFREILQPDLSNPPSVFTNLHHYLPEPFLLWHDGLYLQEADFWFPAHDLSLSVSHDEFSWCHFDGYELVEENNFSRMCLLCRPVAQKKSLCQQHPCHLILSTAFFDGQAASECRHGIGQDFDRSQVQLHYGSMAFLWEILQICPIRLRFVAGAAVPDVMVTLPVTSIALPTLSSWTRCKLSACWS